MNAELRTESNRALAKALAYADCGKFEQAQDWGMNLVRRLEQAGVFQAGASARLAEIECAETCGGAK